MTTIKSLTVAKLFVDVEPVGLTYQITVTELQGIYSIGIVCAPQEQQIDQSAQCEDSEYI